jgi:hypothetical protein
MTRQLPTVGELAVMSSDEIEKLWNEVANAERRAIIEAQLSTMPEPNRDGLIDLSQVGSWERADKVLDSKGRRVHDLLGRPVFMLDD